ncbi:MAG: alpha-ribazole phosphatase [Nitrospiraceae bacterium]|jgi:alpha-ribazole phosphatase/probable phosphoglycerate mutase|nr:alpha-ribazole phosphatase [Nitrospirota bacterium]MDA8337771.1 alpha-ribazole phosphatase [Nitrospiraceae bacterium]
MVTTLYLIRHGETEGSEVKRYKGSIDVPLSEKGIRQIKRASDFIKDKLTAVYCSPLSRALKSAEIISEPHGLKPVVIHGIRERSFGIWEGMSFDEIKEKYPEEFEAWAGNPLKYSPIEGESTIEVRDRVIRALDMILNNHNDEHIAIIAHGGVNRIILCHIMGIPLENIFRIEQDFAAVNIIEFWEKYQVVKLLNGVSIG